jgi:DNA-binding NtrC family response regulator
MEPGLQSLLLCTDDTIVRVLRRVLSELEIGVEQCADLDTTVQKMTRQRFEAVIVDCTSHELASKVLKGIRSAPANKRAVIIAIIDGQNAAKGATELGAHFVLFKPLSLERTRSSFRAVRALMKRERRRHARIPIELPVELQLVGKQGNVRTVPLIWARTASPSRPPHLRRRTRSCPRRFASALPCQAAAMKLTLRAKSLGKAPPS